MIRAAFAIFTLILMVQLLNSYHVGRRCYISKEEFMLMRERNLQEFIDAPVTPSKLNRCGSLLALNQFDFNGVSQFKDGNFQETYFEVPLWTICKILEDTRFLEEHAVCAEEYKVDTWLSLARRAIQALNPLIPLWEECTENRDSEACNKIRPYLFSLQKLVQD